MRWDFHIWATDKPLEFRISFGIVVTSAYLQLPQSRSRGMNPRKRLKITPRRSLTLADLPGDVAAKIFNHVSSTDTCAVSSVNKRFRAEFVPIVFRRIRVRWSDLERASADKRNSEIVKVFSEYAHLVEEVRIVDCYSYGEWQIDVFRLLPFPNLTRVVINSINSSNWLKYRSHNGIKLISLYLDRSIVNTSHAPATKVMSSNPKMFSIDHVSNFSNLKELSLDSYHFDWDTREVTVDVGITSLRLTNCTWEYPFHLGQFNRNNKLETLELVFSSNNSFILSERFNEFLALPLKHDAASLELMSITLRDYDTNGWHKHLSILQFERFVDAAHMPRLRSLKLHGWLLNLRDFVHCDTKLALKRLEMKVQLTDINLDRLSALIEELKRKYRRQGVHLRLDVVAELLNFRPHIPPPPETSLNLSPFLNHEDFPNTVADDSSQPIASQRASDTIN